ncbi:lipase/esterase [Streptomyces albus]|uniref:Lipase/esterase n=1 Tax=Streptomyces albus (strain ATCC 21838 / DSM 41398 / FERM P-419 / JCM 4703 / NBRC 107858) TaxID=1081613 RepID=A0A0B5EEN5_STRA4|nr:lipase/esterase [Streptomyces albus]AOU74708.1 lipase/esterase [Streptomyces albus]
MVYVHGGGWSVGDLDGYDALCRKIAVRSDSRVVSVAYRLAPEHPFPAGLTDVEAAVRWAAERYPEAPLVLAGDSAGANLATVCARRAREHGGPRIAAQLLISPVTDHDPTRPSYGRNTDELLLLRAADMAWFWDLYVPDARLRDDPDVSPLRAGDLSSSPPALIVLAGRDPLYDEGLAYAEALRRAGVPVDLVVHPTMAHGFVAFPSLPQAAETLDALAAAVRGAQRRHQTDPKTDPTEVPR